MKRNSDEGTQVIRLIPGRIRLGERGGVHVPALDTGARPVMIALGDPELRGMLAVKRALRAAVVVGVMAAAWQAGAVIGRF